MTLLIKLFINELTVLPYQMSKLKAVVIAVRALKTSVTSVTT